MNAVPIVLAAVIPLLALAYVLFRAISRGLAGGRISLFSAIALFWVGVALLPVCIFALLVPTLNYVFSTFTSLQIAAWDVGLAISTSIGLILSWIVAAAVGGVATKKLVSLQKRRLQSAN
jgi:hypothetical protein